MTEIEQYQGQAGSALEQWAMDAQQAHRVATSLANTTFVPQSLRGKSAEITAAILTGQEIGLQPMSALRSIDIIQGTPAMRANALRGLVQSKGHDVWVTESTDTRAVVCGKRKGSDQEQKSVWTMDRAQKMGLTGKDNWKKQPAAMLVARATAEVCRLIASDVLLGMPYAVEELEQVDETPKRTARRKAAEPVEPTPEPALEAEPDEPQSETLPVEEPPLDGEPGD